jgi:hypothetical protein
MSTRQTQPYRATSSRAPSQTLSKMQAGRATGAPAAAPQSPQKRRAGVRVPRHVLARRRG